VARVRRPILAGAAPLAPRRKWLAITLATLLFTPGYWCLLIGLVAVGTDRDAEPLAAPYIAFGVAIIPFVFVALAFLSQHPRQAAASVRAMLLALVIGIPVLGFTGDVVTGIVAGMGAGGIAALRADVTNPWKPRALAVTIASLYTFFLLRTSTDVALLVAPAFPFTSIGVADHLAERRRDRAAP
jgi:hypothetical protein